MTFQSLTPGFQAKNLLLYCLLSCVNSILGMKKPWLITPFLNTSCCACITGKIDKLNDFGTIIDMKNNNTNILFKAIVLFFTLQFHAIKPLEMPWYQQFFNSGNSELYATNCTHINMIQNIHCILRAAYHRLSHKTSHLNKGLVSIKNELTDIEQWILNQEQEALLQIKEKYQISNDIWQKYMADVHRMKTIYTKNLNKNHNVIHDPNVPANIFETLITLLQQNGINPQSIHIKMITDQKEIDENPTTIAQAVNTVSVFTSDKSEQDFISYKHRPATIEIFPKMLTQKSAVNIMSTCAHEIQHVIQHHTLTTIILSVYLNHYYNIENDEFKKTSEFHRLAQIHEAQAEILSATKDPEIAKCLKIKRQTMYYPDHLYEEHFYHLAYINMLWKIHGWIEKLQINDLKSVLYQALQIQLLNNCCRINTFKR